MRSFCRCSALLFVLPLLLSGCGGGGSNNGDANANSNPPTPGTAVLSISPNTLNLIATNTGSFTIRNTRSSAALNLLITPNSALSNTQQTTTCTSTLNANSSCTYTVYASSHISDASPGALTLTATDASHSSLSTSANVVVSTIQGTVVENPAEDLVDGQSTFLQDPSAKSVLNLVFVDTGSLDFDKPLDTTNGTCPAPPLSPTITFFDYFAPGTPCASFNTLVSAYTEANPNIKTVVWVGSSSNTDITTYDYTTVANTIGNAINASEANGVAIESSALFTHPNMDDLGSFYETLAALLKTAHKTLYIYEAPWSLFSDTVRTTLQTDGNVIALVPLYDIADTSDNGATATYSGIGSFPAALTPAVQSPIESGSQYEGFPFMYMLPASGTYGNWQDVLMFQYTTPNPLDPYAPSHASPGITYNASGTCTVPNSGTPGLTISNCNSYTNARSVSTPGYTPINPQMFAYTQEALCAISNNDAAVSSPLYSGVIYYNVRPAGFWASQSDKHLNANYPESIESQSWQLLKDWTTDPASACN